MCMRVRGCSYCVILVIAVQVIRNKNVVLYSTHLHLTSPILYNPSEVTLVRRSAIVENKMVLPSSGQARIYTHTHAHTHTRTHTHTHIYIYIYIYIEREREREREPGANCKKWKPM